MEASRLSELAKQVFDEKNKYFITPNKNIVSGKVVDGIITDAELYANSECKTLSSIAALKKEREKLAKGQVPLTVIPKQDYTKYSIAVDAGKSKRRPPPHSKAGEVINIEDDIEAGKKKHRVPPKKSITGGEIEIIDAGKKKSTTKKPATNKSTKKTTKKPAKVGMGKRFSAGEIQAPGFEKNKETEATNDTTLSDIFKRVMNNLGSQTAQIIASGGDPINGLKSDIKFFNKV